MNAWFLEMRVPLVFLTIAVALRLAFGKGDILVAIRRRKVKTLGMEAGAFAFFLFPVLFSPPLRPLYTAEDIAARWRNLILIAAGVGILGVAAYSAIKDKAIPWVYVGITLVIALIAALVADMAAGEHSIVGSRLLTLLLDLIS